MGQQSNPFNPLRTLSSRRTVSNVIEVLWGSSPHRADGKGSRTKKCHMQGDTRLFADNQMSGCIHCESRAATLDNQRRRVSAAGTSPRGVATSFPPFNMLPSTSGLSHCPFTAESGVRIPLGVPQRIGFKRLVAIESSALPTYRKWSELGLVQDAK